MTVDPSQPAQVGPAQGQNLRRAAAANLRHLPGQHRGQERGRKYADDVSLDHRFLIRQSRVKKHAENGGSGSRLEHPVGHNQKQGKRERQPQPRRIAGRIKQGRSVFLEVRSEFFHRD